MKIWLAASLLVIALAISAGAGYLGGSSNSVTKTETLSLTTTQTLTSTTTRTLTVSVSSATASGGPAEVVSVVGPLPPINDAGTTVRVTMENVGGAPITSLKVTLLMAPTIPFSISFNVTSSDPLQPGQSVQKTAFLVYADFVTGENYPLVITGTLVNGTLFSSTVQVQVVPPA